MYGNDFVSNANLQSFVSFLLSDGLAVNEAEDDSPKERYNKHMQGISDGLKSFHEAEIDSFDFEDFDCGLAARPIWDNIELLERLHFEMGFRTGAAFYAETFASKSEQPQDDLHNKKERDRKMDELERKGNKYFGIWYSKMQRNINLQSIGNLIRDNTGGRVNPRSFAEREQAAEEELLEYITELCGPEITKKVIVKVNEYTNIVDTISFSLGMKAGATLQVKLLSDFGTDV